MDKTLLLRDERTGPTTSFAQVKVRPDGVFVFEGVEAGPDVEKYFGDTDFEYWLRLQPDEKDWLLLQLVREHFTSVHVLKKWLDQKGIASEMTSY